MKKLLLSTAIIFAATVAQASEEAVINDTMSVGGFTDSVTDFSAWKGTAEGGIDIFNGNTKSNSSYGKVGVSHEYGKWIHSLKAEALNRKESGNRSAEKYRIGWNSDYKFTEKLFGFGELEWTKDRFSGYDYRFNEIVGLGYIFNDDKVWYWDARAGIGGEHTKTTTGDHNDAILGKIGTKAVYNFNDNVSISEEASYLWTDDLQTLRSETALKSKISESLSFKAGYIIERLSSVPTGRKKSDSHTFVGVAYDF